MGVIGETDGPADLDKDSLDAAVAVPIGEHGQLGRIDLAVGLRDKGEVDAGDELDRRWSLWVLLAAENLERVDTVLVYGLRAQVRAARRGGACNIIEAFQLSGVCRRGKETETEKVRVRACVRVCTGLMIDDDDGVRAWVEGITGVYTRWGEYVRVLDR